MAETATVTAPPPDLPDMYVPEEAPETPEEGSQETSEATEQVNEQAEESTQEETPETTPAAQTISKSDEDRIYHRTRQQLMQELGNWRRDTLDPMREQMSTLFEELKARKVPDADNTEQLDQADDISGQLDEVLKGGYVDEQTHGILSNMAKRLNALARTSDSPVTKDIRSKVDQLDTMMARHNDHIKAVKHWESFNAEDENKGIDGRALWLEAQKIAVERGLTGEQAYGAATIMFDDALELAKEQRDTPETDGAESTPPATSGTKKGATRTKTKGASTSRSAKTGPELDADGLPVGMYTTG